MNICLIDCGLFVEDDHLLDPLRGVGEVSVYTGVPETAEEVLRRAKDAEVIAFALMQFSNEMLDALPKLKILQFVGSGASNFVDMEYAASKGIQVLNIRGYANNAVAEYALSLGLSLVRHVVQGNRVFLSGSWDQSGLNGFEIAGSTVGILGTGGIGYLVAEKFQALGAQVLACDLYPQDSLKEKGVQYVEMEDLFARADLVSIHMTVLPETEGIVTRSLLESMKPSALFVNVSRAELVDTQALYDLLEAGKLGGAALDVFNHEPPAGIDLKLAALPTVIATPHIGFYTDQANTNSIVLSVSSIVEALK